MRVDKLRIFDKKGSNLNLFNLYDVGITFSSDFAGAIGAEAYAVTDITGIISEIVVKSSGWGYGSDTTASLTDPFLGTTRVLPSSEVSIYFSDVSIFNPDPSVSHGILSLDVDISTQYYYPTNRFTAAIFTDPVSVELVETEHLAVFMEYAEDLYIRPFDIGSEMVFKFDDGDEEIQMFELVENTQLITWTEEVIFDISEYVENTPIVVNIGFKASDEGVFERRLKIFHRYNDIDYAIGEIVVNSQSIGKDERYDALLNDFGLPDPKTIPHLFKEADINEEMPDWKLLNYKSKHMILEHHKILPYIGSYKALINSIKWLGYEDIKIKEWFKNVKDNTKLSLYVPYEAEDRSKTILYFSPEERKNLKKTNELSMMYCITRETGDIDEWGVPLVEECYNYSINEIIVKLKSLKDWLERYIIGVNARIVDITGEGVYFERFGNLIYATQDRGNRVYKSRSLTPATVNDMTELVYGEASVGLTIRELQSTTFRHMEGLRFKDLLDYYWDPSTTAFSEGDASLFWWDVSTLRVGPSFRFPLYDLNDIQWKLSVEKTEAGVLTSDYVTSPLFIYDNEIKFYNILDVSVSFYDVSCNLDITIEKGYLRDASTENWEESLAYSIYPNFYINVDASSTKYISYDVSLAIIDGSGTIVTKDTTTVFNSQTNPTYFLVDTSVAINAQTTTTIQTPVLNGYVIESSLGVITNLNGELSLQTDTNSKMFYAYDDSYRVPLLSLINYKWLDPSGTTHILSTRYNLEILDGNIKMEKYLQEPVDVAKNNNIYKKEECYINFNYDTSLDEQKITLNVIYYSPRMPLYSYDPSLYYNFDPSTSLIIDNSTYFSKVNYTGDYYVELFGWDGHNNLYTNYIRENHRVWNKCPIIFSYIDTSCLTECSSSMLSPLEVSTLISNNFYPIFDRQVQLYGLTLETDENDKLYLKVPSISYFVDTPNPRDLIRFYNLTELCSYVNSGTGVINWDPDYQNIYVEDIVNLVKFDKTKMNIVAESSTRVVWTDPVNKQFQVSHIPSGFVVDSSTEIYVQNYTERPIYYIENDYDLKQIKVDSSSHPFTVNQLVSITVYDNCSGYKWGSSFRVLDACLNPDVSFNGVVHTLKGNFPEFILNASLRYDTYIKHAWGAYSDMYIRTENSSEEVDHFNVYLDDSYMLQHYLDNTFVFSNILFDQDVIIKQWYSNQ